MKVYKRRVYYGMFTLMFYLLWFLFKLGGMPDFKKAILSTAVDIIFTLIPLFITVEFLLPKFIYKEKYLRFSIFFFLIVISSGTIIIFSQLGIMGSSVFSYKRNIAKYQEHYFYWFWSDLIFGSYFLVAFISLIGGSMRIAFDRQIAEKQTERLKREKVASELAMLKHQINPHFIFNALNTVYYKIDKSNTNARNILQQFSSLLRYQLYESDVTNVPIEKEIEFLSNYIALQRQRLDENFAINCKGFKEVTGFSIFPHLLIPLVENCFKHVTCSAGDDNYILIECGVGNQCFWLYTENVISQYKNENNDGIGLANVRKRLQLVYPEKHSLKVNQTNSLFKVKLKVKIS